ncbi:proteasome subunit RPN10 (RPN10) [Vairimorpha necatrix]|uniref:Proteasome subunit RPN10 (RPN10) n=1 Tax=Vairimorpha necatrix TaxID=6039 RepID=A0AAX4JDU3_9MICR
MPSITIVIYDNGLSSQNQDYLPSRSILQKEFIQSLINKKFDLDSESMVGIIPVCQEQYNDLITPTKQRDYLYTFLNKCGLYKNPDYVRPLSQSINAFKQREINNKNLIFFIGTKIEQSKEDQMYGKIFELLTCGINVTVVCFGEGLCYFESMSNEIDCFNFKVVRVSPQDDYNNIYGLINENEEEEDPELAEAIRQSLADQKK